MISIQTPRIDFARPARQCALNRGLIGWWKVCPQTAGRGSLLDLCGRNNGQLVGSPSWIGPLDRKGGSGFIDCASSGSRYINAGTDTKFALVTSHLTLAAWVRPRGDYTSTQTIMTNSATSSSLNWDLEYGRTDNKFTYLNNASAVHITSASSVSTDTPTHVMLVRTGSTGAWNFEMYLNGVSDATASTANNPNGGSTNVWIGAYNSSGSPASIANLSIDDVRVWGRALSSDEVRAIYSDSRRGYPLTLSYSRTVFAKSVAAASSIPVFMHHYQQQGIA